MIYFQINEDLDTLIADMCAEGNCDEILLLVQCQHVLEQYTLMVQYVLARSVQTYKATLKILSILMLVFTELIQKVGGNCSNQQMMQICLAVAMHNVLHLAALQ